MKLLKWILLLLFTQISAQEIRIDHVIYVANDLNSTLDKIQELGFTIKKGTQHSNGILNAHIKFKNNSSVEFITINGTPTDDVAKEYQKLINKKESGVYIALTGTKLNLLSAKFQKLKIQHSIKKSSSWSYITFPKNSKLALFFFIEYHREFKNDSFLYKHNNGVKQINTIYIEGDKSTTEFLNNLGIDYLDKQFSTPTGNLIIINNKRNQNRFRIIDVDFLKSKGDIIKLNF